MAQVIIRNLDESVVQAHKRKAALHGRSLEQELRVLLSESARPGPAERAKLAASVRSMTPEVHQPDSTDLVREDRDGR
jgi:plasmid stability protein